MMKSTFEFLRRFFLNYVWLGVYMILLAIIVSEASWGTNTYVSIGAEVLKTIGVAVMVAAVFSFAAGTSDFTDRIRKLLQEIVITRKFLGNIAPESKKLALRSLLRPSESETDRYSDIDEYYDLYIAKALDISTLNVRGSFHINGTAFRDPEEGRVAIETSYSYRLFPSSDGFGSVPVAFYEEDTLSRCERIAISTPEGDREVMEEPVLRDEQYGKIALRKYDHDLSKYDGKFPHLDIDMRVIEYGFDHWILNEFQALQPTDGFNYTLRCQDGLEVKKSLVFVFDANYRTERPGHDVFSIICNQWITEGSGVAVIVGPRDATSPEQETDSQQVGGAA